MDLNTGSGWIHVSMDEIGLALKQDDVLDQALNKMM